MPKSRNRKKVKQQVVKHDVAKNNHANTIKAVRKIRDGITEFVNNSNITILNTDNDFIKYVIKSKDLFWKDVDINSRQAILESFAFKDTQRQIAFILQE